LAGYRFLFIYFVIVIPLYGEGSRPQSCPRPCSLVCIRSTGCRAALSAALSGNSRAGGGLRQLPVLDAVALDQRGPVLVPRRHEFIPRGLHLAYQPLNLSVLGCRAPRLPRLPVGSLAGLAPGDCRVYREPRLTLRNPLIMSPFDRDARAIQFSLPAAWASKV
jgi:hypothetical protein